jgi:hypothetical protein
MSDITKNFNQSSAEEIIEENDIFKQARINRIAVMILAGYSQMEISREAKLSDTTIRAIQKDKDFQKVIQLASAKIFDSAIARLCLNSAKAADKVISILEDPDSSSRIQLQAAKIILEVAEKSKSAALEQRLEALESLVNTNA